MLYLLLVYSLHLSLDQFNIKQVFVNKLTTLTYMILHQLGNPAFDGSPMEASQYTMCYQIKTEVRLSGI